MARYTRRFAFSLNTDRLDYGRMPETFMYDIVHVLTSFADLRDLALQLSRPTRGPPPKDALRAFTAMLDSTGAEFPTVRDLHIDPNLQFRVPRCPNVEAITSVRLARTESDELTMSESALIETCKQVSTLRHFRLCADWPVELVREFKEATPQLRYLAIWGFSYTPYPPEDISSPWA